MEQIKVSVRIKPNNNNDNKVINLDNNSLSFENDIINNYYFDNIFNDNNSNYDIYKKIVHDNIDVILNGYNFCLFAYGQTDSGKTYTLLGNNINNINNESNNLGVNIYTLKQIFKSIERKEIENKLKFLLHFSYYEIYNDSIYDLLNNSDFEKPLNITENEDKNFVIKNLKEVEISDINSVVELLVIGENKRKYAETIFNNNSSRSHTIMQIKIESLSLDTGICSNSIINLIDLAGSERMDDCNNLKIQKEGKTINKSLFYLTRVINLLGSNSKNMHIPYRNSVLTKILKNYLGGNSLTHILLNIKNDKYCKSESISTLNFGKNARNIVNKIEKNTIIKDINSEMNNIIKKYEEKITILNKTNTDLTRKNNDLLQKYNTKDNNILDTSELKKIFEIVKLYTDKIKKLCYGIINKRKFNISIINTIYNSISDEFNKLSHKYLNNKENNLNSNFTSILESINIFDNKIKKNHNINFKHITNISKSNSKNPYLFSKTMNSDTKNKQKTIFDHKNKSINTISNIKSKNVKLKINKQININITNNIQNSKNIKMHNIYNPNNNIYLSKYKNKKKNSYSSNSVNNTNILNSRYDNSNANVSNSNSLKDMFKKRKLSNNGVASKLLKNIKASNLSLHSNVISNNILTNKIRKIKIKNCVDKYLKNNDNSECKNIKEDNDSCRLDNGKIVNNKIDWNININ